MPARAQVWLAQRGCPCRQPVAGTRWQLQNGPAGPLRVLPPPGNRPPLCSGAPLLSCLLFPQIRARDKKWRSLLEAFSLGVNYSHLHNVISLVFFRPYLRLCFAPVTAISSRSAELQPRRTETRFSLCRFISLSVNDTVLAAWGCGSAFTLSCLMPDHWHFLPSRLGFVLESVVKQLTEAVWLRGGGSSPGSESLDSDSWFFPRFDV